MDLSTVTFQEREIPVAIKTDTYFDERVYTVRFEDELLQEFVENPFQITRKYKEDNAPYEWGLSTRMTVEHSFKGEVAKAIKAFENR